MLPFMYDLIGVDITLMPLKLFQAEQNNIINWMVNEKAIALTGKTN